MNDAQELALSIYRLDLQLRSYIETLRRDGIMRQLFPKMWLELQYPRRNRPIGDIRLNYTDKKFVSALLQYFEKYNRFLNKEVRAERHDHHGLHQILEDAIALTRQLLGMLQ